MPNISPEDVIRDRAEGLFAQGLKSIEVGKRLRISTTKAMEIKHAWIARNAPPAPAKPDKPAQKAKKAKD